MFGQSKKVLRQPLQFRPIQAGNSEQYYNRNYNPYSMIPGQYQNPAWNGQFPFMQSPYIQPNNAYPNSMNPYPNPYGNGMYQKPGSQGSNLFENPLQAKEQPPYMNNMNNTYGGYPVMNPYPSNINVPRPPSGVQSVLNSFKNQDGTVDINKMVNTAGQMMNAVTQVSSMVKGLGGIFKA